MYLYNKFKPCFVQCKYMYLMLVPSCENDTSYKMLKRGVHVWGIFGVFFFDVGWFVLSKATGVQWVQNASTCEPLTHNLEQM